MTLQALKSVCESVALLALAGSAIFFAYDSHQTQIAVRAELVEVHGDTQDVAAESRDVTIAMLRPCKPGPCGLIPGISQTVQTLQIQVAQSSTLVNAASRSLTDVASHLDATADSLTATGSAAVATLGQARADLQTANGSIAAVQPVLEGLKANSAALTQAVQHTDALIANPANLEMENNVAHMTATADAVETKATKGYLHPSRNPFKRIWSSVSPFLVAGAKIVATTF